MRHLAIITFLFFSSAIFAQNYDWTAQTSGTDEKLRAVFFIDANTGWIVGGINTKTMLKTVDGGSTWQNITPGNITNN